MTEPISLEDWEGQMIQWCDGTAMPMVSDTPEQPPSWRELAIAAENVLGDQTMALQDKVEDTLSVTLRDACSGRTALARAIGATTGLVATRE